jgi:hypothetical protein
MRKWMAAWVLGALGLSIAVPGGLASAATSPANLPLAHPRLVQIASGLTNPTALAWRVGDGARVYVAEQGGRVRIVSQGSIVGTALTIAVGTGNERGLLGLAFSRNGTKMYIHYTDANGDIRIVEYTMNGSVANLATRRQLLQINHLNFA